MATSELTSQAMLGRYRDTGVSRRTKFFLALRWKLTPYLTMAAALPEKGRILDLGCGHGLLSLAIALESPAREVLGVDHDAERVRLAARAAEGLPNLTIERGSLLAPPPGPWDGIAAIDVFHYFEPKMQNAILSEMHGAVAKDGIFIMREVDPHGGLASRWNRAYETIATRTGFTRTGEQGLHFRRPSQWIAQLEKCGFEVKAARCSSPLFADMLYVCRAR